MNHDPARTQQTGQTVGCNVIAFPVAAGDFDPLALYPEPAPLSMSGSSAAVAVDALMLKRTQLAGIKPAESSGAQWTAAKFAAKFAAGASA